MPLRCIAVAVVLLLGGPSVRAQVPPTDEERARELFDRAIPLLAEERYDEAHDLLVEALELDPRASTAFNLASVLVGSNRAREADDLLDRVERGDYGELPAAHAESVETLRAAIRAQLGRLAIRARGAPAIAIELDGEPVGTIRAGAVIESEVDPGEHEVRGTADGHTAATERVTIAAGERRELDLVLEVVMPEPTPPQPIAAPPAQRHLADDDEEGGSPWLWVGGAGALAVAAAVVVLVLVLSADGDDRPFDCDPVFGCTGV